ncbi:MAG: VWA domain-containing protein, partial [Anaerolineae bacterium]|nr:VWA domain-containing protein [Anaerolineae bacterium]
ALYDGSTLAIQKASEAPNSRRAVIILSDGAEYGGRSESSREQALSDALRLGVPVYTIGLGFGFDRTYLQGLSTETNARFYESPTPDQLAEIYRGIADILRSQYIITLGSDLPGDGTTYTLGLQVTTDAGQGLVETALRAPITTPIVSLGGLPTEPISEAVTVTAEALSDDGIDQAIFQLNDSEPVVVTDTPYSFTIDPMLLPPGSNTLYFTAVDVDGDSAQTSATFEVAPNPPQVAIDGLEANQLITDVTTVTVSGIVTKAPIAGIIIKINDQLVASTSSSTTDVTIDPAAFQPGLNTFEAVVRDTNGERSVVNFQFEVAALPPTLNISGLENGQTLSEPTTITIDATSAQAAIQGLIVKLNDGLLASVNNAASTSVTLDPIDLAPGTNTLTVIGRDANGTRTENTIEFTVPALPPTVSLSGIEVGATISESVDVTAEVSSPQTPVVAVTWLLDGVTLESQLAEPYAITIDPAALEAGAHILSVEVTNEGGQTVTADTAFLVPEPPTATPTEPPTSTPIPGTATATPEATNTSEPTTAPTSAPTSEGATAEPSATAETQASVPTNTVEAVTQAALVPTDTTVPATNTTVPATSTNTAAPATSTNTAVPATSTNTAVPATSTNTAIPATSTNTAVPPTDAPTDVPTEVVTEEVTAEVTEAATEEGTAEVSADVTEEPTEEATAETTGADEPTATNTAQATSESTTAPTAATTAGPTITPIPLTAETQTAGQSQSPLLIGAICLVGLLLLAIIYWLSSRRRQPR